jgi:Protein of unknown function (DUF2924)
LKTAGKAELLAVWRANIGKPPPFVTSRELLAMALAWHLQERKYGGFKPLVRRRLEALARAHRRSQLPAALFLASSFRPGTAIIKLWHGQRHTVIASEHGFRYRGRIYHSLSPIAREITGTRCDGPTFFGLRKGNGPTSGVSQSPVIQRFAAVPYPPIVRQEAIGPGEPQAIDERELTNSLKRVLAPSRRQLETRERFDAVGALLTGLIFDDAGNQMSPIRADKGARRYRYYVSQAQKKGAGSPFRLPAPELEKLVIDETLEALKADVRTNTFAMKLAGPVDPHPALIKALVRGYLWRTELMSGRTKTLGQLITKVRFPRNYVLRILRLGFLAPDLIEAILNGKLPLAVNLEALRHPISLDWAEQREYFGLPTDQHFSSSAPAEIIHFRPIVSGQIRTHASQRQQ